MDGMVLSADELDLVLISAWNDSGGGFTHRLFDGHPDCFVYPFELQLGTGLQPDGFAEWFHAKYRWPAIGPLAEAPPDAIFDAIIDDELKSTVFSPATSKFREFPVDIDPVAWRKAFSNRLSGTTGRRRDVVAAYIGSVFDVWRDRRHSGRERGVIGHCPVLNMDADLVFLDFPNARFLHLVRSPFTGFVDMRARRPEVEPAVYATKWTVVNGFAHCFAAKHPNRFRLLPLVDLLERRRQTLKSICEWLAFDWDETLMNPTWNGQPLTGLYPFGGLPAVSQAHEQVCLEQLDRATAALLAERTAGVRAALGLDCPLPPVLSRDIARPCQ